VLTWSFDGVLLAGAVPLRAYGLLLSTALVAGFLIWRSRMLRLGVTEAATGAFLAWALLAGLLGARLVHALGYEPARFLADPVELARLWRGGLASHGALVGLLLVAGLFARRHRLSFALVADPLALGGALASVLVRLGNFCNSEVVGRTTGGRWGVRFPHRDAGLPLALVPLRHPVQLYEAALGAVVLGALLLLERRRPQPAPGLASALFLFLLFTGRLLLEVFKLPEGLSPSAPLTLGQLLSLPPALAGLVWLLLLSPQLTRPRSGSTPPRTCSRLRCPTSGARKEDGDGRRTRDHGSAQGTPRPDGRRRLGGGPVSPGWPLG